MLLIALLWARPTGPCTPDRLPAGHRTVPACAGWSGRRRPL